MAVRKPLPEPARRPKSLGADVAYTAEQIQVLEGREHVRRRPSMYIGSTSTTGLHQLVYERGVPKAAVKAIGKTDRTGTIVRFWPDPQIFPDVTLDREVIRHRLREMAYLNKRLEIVLAEEELAIASTFYFEGGIVSFVRALNRGKAVVNAMPCYVDREVEGTQV